jgi:hypothetical protein
LQSRRGKEKQKQGVFKFQTKEEILSRGAFHFMIQGFTFIFVSGHLGCHCRNHK